MWWISFLFSALATTASKFDFDFKLASDARIGPLFEGPMFGIDGGFPGIITMLPQVGFSGKATKISSLKEYDDDDSSEDLYLTVIHSFSTVILPIFDSKLPALAKTLNYTFQCTHGRVDPLFFHAFGQHQSSQDYLISPDQDTKIEFLSQASETGYHYLTFALCGTGWTSGTQELIHVSGELSFRNPYGYLPARYYGYLPFLGLLAVLYLLLLLFYSMLTLCWYCKTMLRMQWGILLVIVLGFVETTMWFLTYVLMNDTGETSCCPWRTDIVTAMVFKNMKQTVSVLLLLAVSLGWGVVKPNLGWKWTLSLLVLGSLYLAFGIKFDLVRMLRVSSPKNEENLAEMPFWSLVVVSCDVLFIFLIYTSLHKTTESLLHDHQEHKRLMFARLNRSLMYWGLFWLVFTVFDLLIRMNVFTLPWALAFMQWGFWDVFYLGVLIQIVIIWRPTETSHRYAFSAQLPTDQILDEFEIGDDHDADNEEDVEEEEEQEKDNDGDDEKKSKKSGKHSAQVEVI